MADDLHDDPPLERLARGVVAALASVALMTLALALVIPVGRVVSADDGPSGVSESVGTLWQEGIDHGFTDGGGAEALVPAFLMLVVVLAAVAAIYLCALLVGGRLGHSGARPVRVVAVLLLLGAAWLGLRSVWVAELVVEWNAGTGVGVGAPGGWWLLAGAIVFAALALPRPVRELWERPDGRAPR